MKPKKNSVKTVEHKILGGQAEKLKGKLDLLKEQIRKKKEQKEMSKTSTSIYSKKENSKNQPNSTVNTMQEFYTSKDSLLALLKEAKMETILDKLKENNIHSLQDLHNINFEQIDQWKTIPVGYRIKLKKIIQHHSLKSKIQESKVKEQQIRIEEKSQNQLNIEEIIQNRKSKVIFIPIQREKDEDSQEEAERPLQEAEETNMIQSILHAFRPKQRFSCFKNQTLKKVKHVHWSSEIDEMERNHPHLKTYPKEKIEKDIFHVPMIEISSKQDLDPPNRKVKASESVSEEFPDYKYCWICLKNVKNTDFSIETRCFCSAKCLQNFKLTLNNWQKCETDLKEQQTMEQNGKKQYEQELDLNVM